jgi:hypothetical protein
MTVRPYHAAVSRYLRLLRLGGSYETAQARFGLTESQALAVSCWAAFWRWSILAVAAWAVALAVGGAKPPAYLYVPALLLTAPAIIAFVMAWLYSFGGNIDAMRGNGDAIADAPFRLPWRGLTLLVRVDP